MSNSEPNLQKPKAPNLQKPQDTQNQLSPDLSVKTQEKAPTEDRQLTRKEKTLERKQVREQIKLEKANLKQEKATEKATDKAQKESDTKANGNNVPQEADFEFMNSLSQAALEKPTVRSQLIVWVLLLVLIWLLVWANNAELDKLVRGEGKVVPSSDVQLVQNLEGGIVKNIFVQSGDKVKKGQILVKLDNTQFSSTFGQSEEEQFSMEAKAVRLRAQSTGSDFKEIKTFDSPSHEDLYRQEQSLFNTQKIQLATSKRIIQQQLVQNRTELKDAYSQERQLANSLKLLKKEVGITRPLVKRGYASEVDLLKLQREVNDSLGKLEAVQNSIPKYQSVVQESKEKMIEAEQRFKNEAQEELNEVLAQIQQIKRSQTGLQDKVTRADILSPVDGTISELLVATIGEVVQSGSDIVKIIPTDDSLILETKIAPADIGFLYNTLTARIKFTAYDFSIYGGLDGTVEKISADTITDEEGDNYYIARIKTQKNYLESNKGNLPLLPGMTATVDIVVGKHTVLQYLIKPIIKTKDIALRES